MTCKGCMETVVVSDEVIRELVIEANEEPSLIVTDEIYKNRLIECNSCSDLNYGTTCKYGGFIVHYQAKFKQKSCPSPEGARWKEVYK